MISRMDKFTLELPCCYLKQHFAFILTVAPMFFSKFLSSTLHRLEITHSQFKGYTVQYLCIIIGDASHPSPRFSNFVRLLFSIFGHTMCV